MKKLSFHTRSCKFLTALMSLKKSGVFFIACALMLCGTCEQASAAETEPLRSADSIVIRVNYKRSSSKLELNYMQNSEQIEALQTYLTTHPEAEITHVKVVASASPEGRQPHNFQLSYNRAKAAQHFIKQQFPSYFPTEMEWQQVFIGEDWDGLIQLLQQSDYPDKETLIAIINNDALRRKSILIRRNSSLTWRKMDKELFPYLRAAEVTIYITIARVEKPEEPKTEPITIATPTKPIHELTTDTTSSAYSTKDSASLLPSAIDSASAELIPIPSFDAFRPTYAIKTNLLMDAATALNLEFECSLGKHWSLSVPIYYNPFRFSRKYTVKLLAIQPEGRYWFKESMKGHFVGVHLLTGYYNAYLPGDYRYQDTDGKNPCIGGGISYGYSVTLAKHWALEFTAGVGYMYFDYDRFFKVDNGRLYDTNRKHYFGPTKAGITLVYKLFGKEKVRK